MKKFVSGIMAGIILALCISVFAQNAEIIIEKLPLKYIFNGVEKTPVEGEEGFIYNDRTYVPIRFVSESLGKEVLWNEKNYSISIFDKDVKLIAEDEKLFSVSKSKIQINPEEFEKYDLMLEKTGYPKENCAVEVRGIWEEFCIFDVTVTTNEPINKYGDTEILFVFRYDMNTNKSECICRVDGGKFICSYYTMVEQYCISTTSESIEITDVVTLDKNKIKISTDIHLGFLSQKAYFILNENGKYTLNQQKFMSDTYSKLADLPGEGKLRIFVHDGEEYLLCTDKTDKTIYYASPWFYEGLTK